ncbi:MAG: DUF5615 family PIN-like protein, partial [Acidobacteria bacterium]|nr:DUF5615 family PIN-like protein [Acidobacteriota bacterium]
MMQSLSSQLAQVAQELSGQPRVYADANVPAGLVAFMRGRLRWDVLSVVEHEEMRRLPDAEHFRLAQQLSRTLVTLDRDYLDDRRFPPDRSCVVLVMSAPDEAAMIRLLWRLDRRVFRPRRRLAPAPGDQPSALPLLGRRLLVHPDWTEG